MEENSKTVTFFNKTVNNLRLVKVISKVRHKLETTRDRVEG